MSVCLSPQATNKRRLRRRRDGSGWWFGVLIPSRSLEARRALVRHSKCFKSDVGRKKEYVTSARKGVDGLNCTSHDSKAVGGADCARRVVVVAVVVVSR